MLSLSFELKSTEFSAVAMVLSFDLHPLYTLYSLLAGDVTSRGISTLINVYLNTYETTFQNANRTELYQSSEYSL